MGQTRPDAAAQLAGLSFGVLLLDHDMKVVEANPAAEDFLQRSATRLAGGSVFDAIAIEDANIRARMATSSEGLTARQLPVQLGGGPRRVNITISPLSAHDGWRVMTVTDASQADIGNDAREASALRAPAVLAHEIKNPLAAIRGAGQLLARKLSGGEKAMAQIVTGEVDRIAGLIDRMQRLGREGREPVAACNPHEAIRSAVTVVSTARNGEIAVEERFDPSLPQVLANREALEQVLINLLANAFDACADHKSPMIAIRTRYVSGSTLSAVRNGDAVALPVEIAVIDNGTGIDPGLRDEIFEPFVSGKKGGQGLGLALVRKLMRDMDGHISYHRDGQAGLTEFRCYLPLAGSGA